MGTIFINSMIRRHNMPPLDAKDREVVLVLSRGGRSAARAVSARPGWENPFSKQ